MRSALQGHSRQFSRGNSSVLLGRALPVHTPAYYWDFTQEPKSPMFQELGPAPPYQQRRKALRFPDD